MLKQLEARIPIKGRIPLVNWYSIASGLMLIVITAAFWSAWDRVCRIYALPEKVAALEDSTQTQLPQILDELRKIRVQQQAQAVLTGCLVVTNGDSNFDPAIWLNVASPAIRYESVEKLTVKNMTGESRRDFQLAVHGRMTNPDSSVLGEINHTAAVELRAVGQDRIRVILRPAEESAEFPYR